MTPLARPFAALRPRPETAQAVIAPPYDVVDVDEARLLADGCPDSFLHVSRPEIDFPVGTDPYSEAVYRKGAGKLHELVARGVLERDTTPGYYVYRLTDGDHEQTGLALAASIAAYEAGRIHAHERTRPDKETDRVRNILALNAQTGPVMLAHRASRAVDALLDDATASRPLLEARGQHDVVHRIWRIDDPKRVTALTGAIDALGELYIADGHHRSAAAARVAAERRSAASDRTSHEYFLAVTFPDDQMRIFDYNRVVRDLNGRSASEFLATLDCDFDVTRADAPVRPERAGLFGMYLDGTWFRLAPRDASAADDPVARLDVSILQQRLLDPYLGIGDPRTDERIAFVGGVRGLEALERSVDSGRSAVAFALYPTGIGDLMDVADAGLLMPPKSTWFEPKLADGLLTHVLDDA